MLTMSWRVSQGATRSRECKGKGMKCVHGSAVVGGSRRTAAVESSVLAWGEGQFNEVWEDQHSLPVMERTRPATFVICCTFLNLFADRTRDSCIARVSLGVKNGTSRPVCPRSLTRSAMYVSPSQSSQRHQTRTKVIAMAGPAATPQPWTQIPDFHSILISPHIPLGSWGATQLKLETSHLRERTVSGHDPLARLLCCAVHTTDVATRGEDSPPDRSWSSYLMTQL